MNYLMRGLFRILIKRIFIGLRNLIAAQSVAVTPNLKIKHLLYIYSLRYFKNIVLLCTLFVKKTYICSAIVGSIGVRRHSIAGSIV